MTATPNRREFLIRTGLAGAGLAVAAATARVPSTVGAAPASPTTVASPADWADLARATDGTLLLPGDPSYAVERLPWNTIYDRLYPQAVLQVSSVADVQRAVDFCRDTGVQPIARSGGHSFQGFSAGSGLIIDLAGLRDVQMNAKRTRARIGAGANLLHVYDALFAQGAMAIPGGTCPTVGIAGLTQGGGIGPFTREYGLTLDRLLGAHIVMADGRARYISRQHDADIFWAIRGGGGGSFGVVTSFDFAPVPVGMQNVVIDLTFGWRHADRVLEAFQQWVPTVPLNAHPGMTLRTTARARGAVPSVSVSLWHRGPRRRADALVAEFIRELGVRPTARDETTGTFFEQEYREYCDGLRAEECARNTKPPGALPRVGLSTCSEITRSAWPTAANDTLLSQVERWQRSRVLQPAGVDAGLQAGKVIIEPVDGAVHRVAPHATAWPHRQGFLCMQYQARVPMAAPPQLVAASQAWLDTLYARLAPWRTGDEYSNYGNRGLKGWGTAYFGGNLARLRRIKAARDPGNLFRFAQSIRPARAPGR